VGEAVVEARRQVELTRQALEADVDRLEARLRAELDWRARLRRQAPQLLAVLGGVAVLALGVVAVRRALRGDHAEPLADPASITLPELAAEVQALREEIRRERRRTGLVSRLAGAALSAAIAQGADHASRRLVGQARGG
jgi:hypothetical protein